MFTPGPTPVPPEVLRAVSAPQPHHKSAEFREMMMRVSAGLRVIFQTKQPALPITCSGTGGIEAIMSAIHRAGDKVIIINNGRFAARWKSMLEIYGASVYEISKTWGEIASPEDVAEALSKFDADAVWLVHSETSTGALSDVGGICDAVKQVGSRALICSDGITSIGAYDISMDELGVDAAIASSQKAFMCPPGLAFVALSERAWEMAARPNRSPAVYLDINAAKKALENGLAVFTPAVNILSGLDIALEIMQKETLASIAARHKDLARLVRKTCASVGLELLSSNPSNTVTVVKTPGYGERLTSVLRDNLGILIENGQDHLRNEVVRIGHLGWYSKNDILAFCSDFVRAVDIARPQKRYSAPMQSKSSGAKESIVVLATNNQHKREELSSIFANTENAPKIKLLTLEEAGLSGIAIEETGRTFEENAYIKAEMVSRLTGLPALADDTGLEVEALGRAPGAYSARYAGEDANDAANRAKLLENLRDIVDRAARFRSVLCYVDGERVFFTEGICSGRIADEETGVRGFGYDSIFIPDGYAASFAEMSPNAKNAISHRGLAARQFLIDLTAY